MLRENRHNRAVALITAVSVMMVLAVMGIAFVRMAALENSAAKNYSDTVSARCLAYAGMDYAIQRLRADASSDFNNHLVVDAPAMMADATPDWWYFCPKASGDTEDNTGHGCLLRDIHSTDDPRRPSYYSGTPVLGRKVSNSLGSSQQVYSLKIIDACSQLNLNAQIDAANPNVAHTNHMATMIDNLSKAIVSLSFYNSRDGSDDSGPLHGLGAQIVAKREAMGGFNSKLDLLSVAGINNQDLQDVWDYITVHPTPAEMLQSNIYRMVTPDAAAGSNYNENCAFEHRSPVNVNTAPWPVLVAVFQGLSKRAVKAGDVARTITESEAQDLADNICASRPFGKSGHAAWKDFYSFIDNIKGDIFSADASEDKANLIKANCDPNVSLRRLNTDACMYQDVNKTDLTYYTTELCFFPLGTFEINSLGQILDTLGNVQSANEQYIIVNIFDPLYHTSQHDFEGGNDTANTAYVSVQNKIATTAGGYASATADTSGSRTGEGLHAFSFPNNLQKSYTPWSNLFADATTRIGSVQPLWYNSETGMLEFDDITNASCLFKASFNGQFDAEHSLHSLATAGGGKTTAGLIAVPASDATTPSALAADGVVFWDHNMGTSGVQESDCLYYSTHADATNDGNFPKLVDDGDWDDGDDNKGTLMFWFKLNKNWDATADEWRTVFFSTSKYTVPDISIDQDSSGDTPNVNAPFTMGVQRQIQMKVQKVNLASLGLDEEALAAISPNLRRVEILIRYKFFSYQNYAGGSVAWNPGDDDYIPYSHVEYARKIVLDPINSAGDLFRYGMEAQRWYHLAIRWHRGVKMESFNESGGANGRKNRFAVLSGYFQRIKETDNTYVLVPGPLRLGSVIVSPGIVEQYDDGSYIVDNLEYDDDLGNSNFTAISEGLMNDNRFYVGYTPGYTPPEITIDDVRVSKDILGIEADTGSPIFLPSRYPLSTVSVASDDCYGVFQNKFFSANHLVYTDLTLRTNTDETTEAAGVWDGLSVATWRAIWRLMTDRGGFPKKTSFANQLRLPARVNLTIYRTWSKKHGWQTRKRVNITIFKDVLDGQVQNYIVMTKQKVDKEKPVETTSAGAYSDQDAYLSEILKRWYAFARGLDNTIPADPNSLVTSAPVVVDHPLVTSGYDHLSITHVKDPNTSSDNNAYIYEQRFCVEDGLGYPIQESPVLDDVTIVVLKPTVYRECMDFISFQN